MKVATATFNSTFWSQFNFCHFFANSVHLCTPDRSSWQLSLGTISVPGTVGELKSGDIKKINLNNRRPSQIYHKIGFEIPNPHAYSAQTTNICFHKLVAAKSFRKWPRHI